jgi:hypothetical protein
MVVLCLSGVAGAICPPVLRNILIFAESAHLEIVTPLANEITPEVLHELRQALEPESKFCTGCGAPT